MPLFKNWWILLPQSNTDKCSCMKMINALHCSNFVCRRQLAEPIPSFFISPPKWALRVGQLYWTNSNYKSSRWWIAQLWADIYSPVQSGTLIKLLQADRPIRGLELEASMVAQKGRRGGRWGVRIDIRWQAKEDQARVWWRERKRERWAEKTIMAGMRELDKKDEAAFWAETRRHRLNKTRDEECGRDKRWRGKETGKLRGSPSAMGTDSAHSPSHSGYCTVT